MLERPITPAASAEAVRNRSSSASRSVAPRTVAVSAPYSAAAPATEKVARRIPDGPNPDLLTFGITANFQLLIASVYTGLASRALDVGAEALKNKRSAKHGTSFAEIPQHRDRLADALRDYLAVPAQLATYAREFDELVDHGTGWPQRFVAARLSAGEAARRCVEEALKCSGGAGYDNSSELNRLYRDALAGLFHPQSADAARPTYAAALLDD